MYDILIMNGTVIDGTKAPRFRADVGIQGDRIQRVGNLDNTEAQLVIDAHGKIIAPGFVDVHTHSDAWLLKMPHFFPKTSQGFTTEIIMADGISYAPVNAQTVHDWIFYLRCLNGLRLDEYRGWNSLADYMALLDRHNVQNVATHIPYANIRTLACGFGRQSPDDYQMRQIKSAIAQGMEQGAVGLSTGMDYIAECFASTDELVEACTVMAAAQGLYVTHVRYKKGTLDGVKEAVEIGKRAGVPVHISHLKANTQAEADALLDYIDKIAVHEVSFSFDVYPYLASSTMLNYLLPYEVWEDGPLAVMSKLTSKDIRSRFAEGLALISLDNCSIAWVGGKENARHQGKTLAQYVYETGLPAADALSDLLIEERLAVLLVFQNGSDDLVDPFLAHSCYMMGTDGIYFPDSVVHPRVYGSAARVLGACVRDKKLFSLEDAVHKLSGYPAERFGLKNRGTIHEGSFADVVIFDADTIRDLATFESPHQCSVGVEHVLVNGVPIIRDSQPIDSLAEPLPGRYLKASFA